MSAAERRSAAWGAVAGVAALALVSVAVAVIERRVDDFEDSPWFPALAAAAYLAFVLAGSRAGSLAARAGSSTAGAVRAGALAGAGAVALWVPVRILIWWARGAEERFAGGSGTALPVGQLAAALVVGSALAALAAWITVRIGGGRAKLDGGGESVGRPRTDFDPSEERPDSAGQGAG